jgi:hypothetical protein
MALQCCHGLICAHIPPEDALQKGLGQRRGPEALQTDRGGGVMF